MEPQVFSITLISWIMGVQLHDLCSTLYFSNLPLLYMTVYDVGKCVGKG